MIHVAQRREHVDKELNFTRASVVIRATGSPAVAKDFRNAKNSDDLGKSFPAFPLLLSSETLFPNGV